MNTILNQQSQLAQQYLNKSVIKINTSCPQKAYLMGIKNTPSIRQDWIKSLEQEFEYHTIDTMAHNGRAIDPNLINPVTLRQMTGSSSGTAINVLMGINDLGLGTDGGGSVIYPAIATNLYSVMLAGIGFSSDISKKSTDNISFTPSLGLLSFHKSTLNKALNLLVPKEYNDIPLKIAGDQQSLAFFKQQGEILQIPDTDNRELLIEYIETLFQKVDIILIHEKQIDIHAYGDSVLGTTSPYFAQLQKLSNKKIGKILNMIKASVFTVPSQEAASGYMIIAKNGIDPFYKAWELFNLAPELRTNLFLEYFGTKEK